MGEMAKKPAKERVMVQSDEDIGSILSQPTLSFVRRKSAAIRFQPPEDGFSRKTVDVVEGMRRGHAFILRP